MFFLKEREKNTRHTQGNKKSNKIKNLREIRKIIDQIYPINETIQGYIEKKK